MGDDFEVVNRIGRGLVREHVDGQQSDQTPEAIDVVGIELDEANSGCVDRAMRGAMHFDALTRHGAGEVEALALAGELEDEALAGIEHQRRVVLNPRAGRTEVDDRDWEVRQAAGHWRIEWKAPSIPLLNLAHDRSIGRARR